MVQKRLQPTVDESMPDLPHKKKTVRHGISSKSGFILGKTPQARPLTTSMQSCHTLSLLVSQSHPCIPELISLSIHLLKRSTHFLTKIISLKRSFSSQPFFSHDHTNYLILSFLIFIAFPYSIHCSI